MLERPGLDSMEGGVGWVCAQFQSFCYLSDVRRGERWRAWRAVTRRRRRGGSKQRAEHISELLQTKQTLEGDKERKATAVAVAVETKKNLLLALPLLDGMNRVHAAVAVSTAGMRRACQDEKEKGKQKWSVGPTETGKLFSFDR